MSRERRAPIDPRWWGALVTVTLVAVIATVGLLAAAADRSPRDCCGTLLEPRPQLVSAGDRLWLSAPEGLTALAPTGADRRLVARAIPQGAGLAVGDGGGDLPLWAVDGKRLWRIDADGTVRRVAHKPRWHNRVPAATAHGLWLAQHGGRHLLFIGNDGRVRPTIALPVRGVTAMAAVGDDLWVAATGPLTRSGGRSHAAAAGSLLRLDAVDGVVRDRVRVGRYPSALAIGGGRVVVANGDDRTLTVVDTTHGRVLRTLALDRAAAFPSALVSDGRVAWLAADGRPVLRIDLESGGRTPLPGTRAVAFALAGAGLVGSDREGTVTVVAPFTPR